MQYYRLRTFCGYLTLSIVLSAQTVAVKRQRTVNNLYAQNGLNGIPNSNSQDGSFVPGTRKLTKNEVQGAGQEDATNFEIKATMTKCRRPKKCDGENNFQCTTNDTHHSENDDARSECDQDNDKILQACDKKISLTLKIKNRGLTNCKPQYIILDHVFDPATDQKQKLLNPYVLKIRQRPVFQVYDLVFENVVNSGPIERVKSKNDYGYTGCSIDPLNATCGSVQYDNKDVPFSTGFCCSCLSPRDINDAGLNLDGFSNTIASEEQLGRPIEQDVLKTDLELPDLNEPAVNADSGVTEIVEPHLPADNKIDYVHQEFTETGVEIKQNYLPANTLSPSYLGSAPRIGRQSFVRAVKDRIVKKRVHRRGGQDCDDKYTPPNADPDTYHDSAHCMEFSDLWYSIYRVAHPDIDHTLDIQIFEKCGMTGNNICWREVTSSGAISVGTSKQRNVNEDGSILAYYAINKDIDTEFALDSKTHRILIPEIDGKDVSEYPEVRGGPEEYLVVKDSDIDLSGKKCNKAGVGYEAFVNQPRKCDSDRDSCLQNQPKQLWQHDHDLETDGKKGCYFLKYYGYLPDNPVRMKPCNGSTAKRTQDKYLYMYYLPCVTSNVNIDFAADTNAVLSADSLAIITEVYTETLNPKRVTVIAKIVNAGLVSSVFYAAIGACPMEVPASFGSITSQPVLIAPQQQHVFTLVIYCELPTRNFYCSLEVFNMKQKLLSVRRIRFQRTDRCICVWHCQCACFLSDGGLKCTPLEIEQYHAAGFQGGMPVASQVIHYSELDDIISVILHIILLCCLTLWYMGLIKALLGLCILPIGIWGLDKILDLPKKLNRYYEQDLKYQKVVYDEDGWPVHPETGKRVHSIAPPTQFAINMVFFFIFPFALIWNLCKKLTGPKYAPDETVSDLDICKCKASQISLLRDYSLQNSAMKNSDSNQDKKRNLQDSSQVGKTGSKGKNDNQNQDKNRSFEDPNQMGVSGSKGRSASQIDDKNDPNQDTNKKKRRGCLPRHSKSKDN